MATRAIRSKLFQHRHYEAIAAIIRSIGPAVVRFETARAFTAGLDGTNPKFNADRFFAAATKEEDSK